MSLIGRRFAIIEIDKLTERHLEGHVLYAFEVQAAPVWLRVRRWVHVALWGWS